MAVNHNTPPTNPAERRWLAMIAILAVGGLHGALPASMAIAPRWLLLTIVSALLAASVITRRRAYITLHIALGHLTSAIITLFMLGSLFLLVHALPAHKEPPMDLLRSAALLWFTNVLVFASWYWHLDAGGPHQRAQRTGHPTGAFLFPQMVSADEHAREPDGRPWSPRFIDYLYLAFNTSTAFSPTDTAPISRWAKALMMTQSLISFTATVILVGRAINIM